MVLLADVHREEIANPELRQVLRHLRRDFVREDVDDALVEVDLAAVGEEPDCGRREALRMRIEHVRLVQRVERLPAALGNHLTVADDHEAVHRAEIAGVECLLAAVDEFQNRLARHALRFRRRRLH